LLSFLYAASLLAPLVLFKHRSFIRMQRARLLSLKTLRVAFLALLARRRLARPIRADFPKPNARQLFRPTRSLQCSCTLTLLALSRHPLWNILPLALAVVCLTSAWVQDRGDSLASLEIRRSRRTATPFATLARTNFQRLVKKGSQSLDFLKKKTPNPIPIIKQFQVAEGLCPPTESTCGILSPTAPLLGKAQRPRVPLPRLPLLVRPSPRQCYRSPSCLPCAL
jgi:hypothetical protein